VQPGRSSAPLDGARTVHHSEAARLYAGRRRALIGRSTPKACRRVCLGAQPDGMVFAGACGMPFGSSTSPAITIHSDDRLRIWHAARLFAFWGGITVSAMSLAPRPSPYVWSRG
jgi:hypothetical protein